MCDVARLITFHTTQWSRLPRVWFDRASWLRRPLALFTTTINNSSSYSNRPDSGLRIASLPLFNLPHRNHSLHPPEMARRGRFHVLPADNTFPIEDFDMFKTIPKTPEPRHVPRSVSRRWRNDTPLSCDSANGHSRYLQRQRLRSSKSSTPRSSSR
jgi:hypothetical protein